MIKTISLLLLLVLPPGIYAQEPVLKPLIIDFSEIDSATYYTYKKNYYNPLRTNAAKQQPYGTSFSVAVAGKEKEYLCADSFYPCYYYRGYLPDLNSYVITYCKDFCYTFLLDKDTGWEQELVSPYDSECAPPLLSKAGNRLLVFATNVFRPAAWIALHVRDPETGKFNFTNYLGADLQTSVYEAVWVNEHSFALKTYSHMGGTTGDEPQEVQYLAGRIREGS